MQSALADLLVIYWAGDCMKSDKHQPCMSACNGDLTVRASEAVKQVLFLAASVCVCVFVCLYVSFGAITGKQLIRN